MRSSHLAQNDLVSVLRYVLRPVAPLWVSTGSARGRYAGQRRTRQYPQRVAENMRYHISVFNCVLSNAAGDCVTNYWRGERS